MKIGIIGANGKSGLAVLKEAQARKLDVTAIVRHAENIPTGTPLLIKDVYELTTADIEEFDVLIDALGFWTDLEKHVTSTEHLLNITKNLKTRLLFVGGAGSLFVDADHQVTLKDTPDFPEKVRPLATAMGEALDLIKNSKNVNWTYLSPAAVFNADGERTGHYEVAGEILTPNKDGVSEISYADYAIALVDEMIEPKHLNQRFSVFQ